MIRAGRRGEMAGEGSTEMTASPLDGGNGATAPMRGLRHVLPRVEPLKRDIDRFRARWPEPAAGQPFPGVTWEQLTRQVEDLAVSDSGRRIAAEALAGLRKLSGWMPPELVLREALVIAWAAMDESFAEPSQD